MAGFTIHFFICNIFISIIICIILFARRIFYKKWPARLKYNLWFILTILFAAPFLKLKTDSFLHFFEKFNNIKNQFNHSTGKNAQTAKDMLLSGSPGWINDFNMSEANNIIPVLNAVLSCIWFAGTFVMLLLFARAAIHLCKLKQSAMPLQNKKVYNLYQMCLNEMGIKRKIPVFSTAFLKSPVLSGFINPQIYLPIHLISEYNAKDMRFMLLHELQHYRHKDALMNFIINVICIIYWFNPLVWFVLKEIRTDREIACDTSVLQMLDKDEYIHYGHTLINLAEKISLAPFPFTTGISGNIKQTRKRIINIANYKPLPLRKKIYSIATYILTAIIILASVPFLSIKASGKDYYNFSERNISYINLDSQFNGYNGSFVLYDINSGIWTIYNMENATKRTPPASTYKIYSALNALETGIINPGQTQISWDGRHHYYNTWNKDQTLKTAMQNSVTWYFQELDKKAGLSSIRKFIQKTGYGNQYVTGDTSSYWLNSSLKISPVEQVIMLRKLYNNEFNFSEENIETVKNAIHLYSGTEGSFYGKTGTEESKQQNISGWFTGFIEKPGNTYFFATNIQGEHDITGPVATELTFSILSDLKIWNR